MKHGNGKIANLPDHIRNELNWRINDGDEGQELVDWLNAKPEVVDVVTRLFDGKPISPQNLSFWRTHGYLRWHAYHVIMRETCELAQNSGVVEATGIGSTTVVSTVCTTHNAFGKLYLLLVIPFHKWGVQRLMAHAVARGRL